MGLWRIRLARIIIPSCWDAYALALHESFLQTGDAASRQEFFKLADFLVEMQKASRTGFGWEYDVPSLKYYVMAPWVSGMGQGLAMSRAAARPCA